MVATSVHPQFKLNWISKTDENLEAQVQRLLKKKLEEFEVVVDFVIDPSSEDDKWMFFTSE